MDHVRHQILHGIGRVANKFRGDVSVVKRRKITWALSKTNFVDRNLINGYYYEPYQIKQCEAFVDQFNLEAFLDIGANFGLYSLHLARHTQLKEILAFEPVSQNYNQLCANIFLNRFDKVIKPYKLALSNEDCTRTIYVDSLSTGVSKFQDWAPIAGKKTKHREYYGEAVEVKPLDKIIDWQGRRLLAKIDVEGNELRTLEGMTRILTNNRAVLQIEVQHVNAASVGTFLRKLSYNEIGKKDCDWYFSNM
jgi:FkbM family methyltransferase